MASAPKAGESNPHPDYALPVPADAPVSAQSSPQQFAGIRNMVTSREPGQQSDDLRSWSRKTWI
ncbi:MAG: hypothetical protein KME07_06270 [Pegethrix bostrychoides GSE-TBD4-15B]|uniref:Uncharacterized protein n=1 Tax=Pegethrix bostrychoides GSE-TBD4-15B TaxID=2839662 RepID=A0A951U3X4_9CYAN|nr:hypothetical protein [Pegethrix bostrychoides GSE-TBD4-15B]